MRIDRVSEWLERRCTLFLDTADTEGIGAVAASCKKVGRSGFATFLSTHRAETFDLMSGAADPLTAALSKMPDEQRHLMLLAALFRLRQALCVSAALSDRAADMALDQDLGNLSVRAAEAGELIVDGWPDYWPFEDWADPFESS